MHCHVHRNSKDACLPSLQMCRSLPCLHTKTTFQFVRFQVLTAASLCSLVEVCQHFRGACYLHHQGDDDGGSKHLWDIGKLLPDYMVQKPRIQPSTTVRFKANIIPQYCLSRTAVPITLFTLTSLHPYIWQVSDLTSQPSYTDGKVVQLDWLWLMPSGTLLMLCLHTMFQYYYVPPLCGGQFDMQPCNVCTTTSYAHQVLCLVKLQHVRTILTWKLRIFRPMFIWTFNIVFGCVALH
jgi:hypothetical protein